MKNYLPFGDTMTTTFIVLIGLVILVPILLVIIEDWRVTFAGIILAGFALAEYVHQLPPV